jgi:hypothetical protein
MANKQGHPFLDPLWRRVLLIAACAAWTLVELYYGNMFWVVMVGAVTVYGAYTYLYDYEPSDSPPKG